MEELLEILNDIKDDADFENCTTLIDDAVLDSFDILSIISALNDHYDIQIPAS
ncbi:MAG: acyl carrier protein, partial [Solobacterium sp.]|nr:acyl carrier protein [Solobacterium sp.]